MTSQYYVDINILLRRLEEEQAHRGPVSVSGGLNAAEPSHINHMHHIRFHGRAGRGAADASEGTPSPYPNMAPLEQYLMDRDAEIALARSAAPEMIANDAEVLVLGRKGYETAVKGKNGFVCIVHRSWTSEAGDAEFWNPKRRGPMCLNAKAARAYLPNTILRTNLVLAGKSETQMFDALKTAYEKQELPALEPGAMCYMLSRQGYLNDRGGHWHPHVMFFLPPSEAASWGANLSGSPILKMTTLPTG